MGISDAIGFGAENVLKYTMVDAAGNVLLVDERGVETEDGIFTPHSSEGMNLFYGLKGAGSSFGIVTEFVYKVYRRPEPKAVLLFLHLESLEDIDRLTDLSRDTSLQVSIFKNVRFRELGLSTDNLVRTG